MRCIRVRSLHVRLSVLRGPNAMSLTSSEDAQHVCFLVTSAAGSAMQDANGGAEAGETSGWRPQEKRKKEENLESRRAS